MNNPHPLYKPVTPLEWLLAVLTVLGICLLFTFASAQTPADIEAGSGPVHNHSLYDPECCGGGDCSQVECDELIDSNKPGETTRYHAPEGYDVYWSKGQEKQSKTKKCGVCYNRYPDMGMHPARERSGYCVYKQFGS